MSTKNSLKDRIKKPNPTQAFFNSYDSDKDANDNEDKKQNIESTINNEVNGDIEINKDFDNEDTPINNNDNKTYVNNNIDVVVNNDDNDYLRELAIGKKPVKKKNKKIFTSFYMDPDLAVEVDKISARGEKGDKSKLINMGIRKLLEDYGVIEKK